MGAEVRSAVSYNYGKVLRVHSIGRIRALLDLRFSVHIERDIVIEGVDAKLVPQHLHAAAMHCLIILLGSRNIMVHSSDEERSDGSRLGRVFLDDRLHETPVPLADLAMLEHPLLEVGSYFTWLSDHGFKDADVIYHLTGKRKAS